MNAFELHQRYMAAKADQAFQLFLARAMSPLFHAKDWKPEPKAKP